jgi:Flp pilus assembly protein TadB
MNGLLFFVFAVLALWAAVYGFTLWHERRKRRARSVQGVKIASWLRDGWTLGEAIKGKRDD